MLIDVHQHLWSEPLVRALTRRRELPFVRREHGLSVLFLAGEQPYVIGPPGEQPAIRAELVRRDGIDQALVALSSPLGIELLPRAQADELIDAYHEGALALGERFGAWGALALDGLDPDDVDTALQRGCIGLSLPAGALASAGGLEHVAPALERLQRHGAPLFVHPGRGVRHSGPEPSLGDPLWWPAMTRYVAEMQAAWLTLAVSARRRLPRLRIVFSMLAGLAPLQAERLLARGGPPPAERDPLIFYEVSSYGPRAVRALAEVVGHEQLLYGSDRPVVSERDALALREQLDWRRYAANGAWLLAAEPAAAARPTPARTIQAAPRRISILQGATR